jgi:hypothetical protein
MIIPFPETKKMGGLGGLQRQFDPEPIYRKGGLAKND